MTLYYKKGSSSSQEAVLYCPQGAFFPSRDQVIEIGRHKDVLVVYDGVDIDGRCIPYKAKVLVFSSPYTSQCKEIQNLKGVSRIYVDIWSEDEIRICAKKLYPYLTAAALDASLSLWGPIPRYTLEKNGEDDDLIEDAVAKCNLAALVASAGGSHHSMEISNRLFHLHVGQDFKTRVMLIASEEIASRIACRLYYEEPAALQRWITASSDLTSAVGCLRGAIWEGLVNVRLTTPLMTPQSSIKLTPQTSFKHRPMSPALPATPTLQEKSFKENIFKGNGFKKNGFKENGLKENGHKEKEITEIGYKKNGFKGDYH